MAVVGGAVNEFTKLFWVRKKMFMEIQNVKKYEGIRRMAATEG
jgi:hypothetical protein